MALAVGGSGCGVEKTATEPVRRAERVDGADFARRLAPPPRPGRRWLVPRGSSPV